MRTRCTCRLQSSVQSYRVRALDARPALDRWRYRVEPDRSRILLAAVSPSRRHGEHPRAGRRREGKGRDVLIRSFVSFGHRCGAIRSPCTFSREISSGVAIRRNGATSRAEPVTPRSWTGASSRDPRVRGCDGARRTGPRCRGTAPRTRRSGRRNASPPREGGDRILRGRIRGPVSTGSPTVPRRSRVATPNPRPNVTEAGSSQTICYPLSNPVAKSTWPR